VLNKDQPALVENVVAKEYTKFFVDAISLSSSRECPDIKAVA